MSWSWARNPPEGQSNLPQVRRTWTLVAGPSGTCWWNGDVSFSHRACVAVESGLDHEQEALWQRSGWGLDIPLALLSNALCRGGSMGRHFKQDLTLEVTPTPWSFLLRTSQDPSIWGTLSMALSRTCLFATIRCEDRTLYG